MSIDRFTDAVQAHGSRTRMRTASLRWPWACSPRPGTTPGRTDCSLWGSLDVDYTLDGTSTTARVSGEKLSAEARDSSVLLGAGGTWRRGNLGVNAGISAREALDSGSEEYGATLNLGLQF